MIDGYNPEQVNLSRYPKDWKPVHKGRPIVDPRSVSTLQRQDTARTLPTPSTPGRGAGTESGTKAAAVLLGARALRACAELVLAWVDTRSHQYSQLERLVEFLEGEVHRVYFQPSACDLLGDQHEGVFVPEGTDAGARFYPTGNWSEYPDTPRDRRTEGGTDTTPDKGYPEWGSEGRDL